MMINMFTYKPGAMFLEIEFADYASNMLCTITVPMDALA